MHTREGAPSVGLVGAPSLVSGRSDEVVELPVLRALDERCDLSAGEPQRLHRLAVQQVDVAVRQLAQIDAFAAAVAGRERRFPVLDAVNLDNLALDHLLLSSSVISFAISSAVAAGLIAAFDKLSKARRAYSTARGSVTSAARSNTSV